MKVLILKRKVLVAVAICLCVVVISVCGLSTPSLASVYFGIPPKKYPIYSVATNEKNIAITFDAAWGADKTQGILDILEEFGVKATFFLVGIWIEKYSDMTKKISESGNEIGSHSYNHPDLTKLDKSHIKTELEMTNNLLMQTTGKTPTLFRAPYGAYNDTLMEVLEEMGMKGIQWNIDTLDWKGYTSNQVLNRVLSKLENGSIILCHNNADNVLESTRLILASLQNKGYKFVTVGELTKDVKDVKIGVGYM